MPTLTDSPSPPVRRQRFDHNGDEPQGKITRSKYWFDDGNVILQAGNTQFRVHRSMLAQHSTVFKDMFSIPQPEQPSEPYIDGCPIIPLSDQADDVEQIISIFYGNFRTNDTRALMPFKRLAAILRLGKKYDIDHFLEEGLRRIRAEFPTELKLWNESCESTIQIKNSDSLLEDIIDLAHELSIMTVLPAVYTMHATSVNAETTMDGRECGGTRLVLNQTALKACVRGREKLLLWTQRIFLQWLASEDVIPDPSCISATHCKSQRMNAILSLQIMGLQGTITMLDPISVKSSAACRKLVCPNCVASVETAYDKAREDLWQSLPEMFGLPTWVDLKDFDA